MWNPRKTKQKKHKNPPFSPIYSISCRPGIAKVGTSIRRREARSRSWRDILDGSSRNIWQIYGKYTENIENIIWWVASTGDSLWEWHQKWALLAAHQELLKLPILGSVVPAVPHHQFRQSWEQYRWKAQGLKFVTGKQMTSASGAGWVPEYQLLKSYGAGWRHLKYLSHHNIMATSQSQLSRAIPKPITMVCCSINGLVPENWNRNPPSRFARTPWFMVKLFPSIHWKNTWPSKKPSDAVARHLHPESSAKLLWHTSSASSPALKHVPIVQNRTTQSHIPRVETCLPFSNIKQKDQSSYRQHNLPSACGSSKTFPPQSASHFGSRNTLNRCSDAVDHLPCTPVDGKPWKSQPVFTEHNWPQVDQKRGCAPQLQSPRRWEDTSPRHGTSRPGRTSPFSNF